MLLDLTVLYIDSHDSDAIAFRERVMGFPGLEGFNVSFEHKHSINSALQWLSLNKRGDLIVCFDPSSRGIGEQNVTKAIHLLKKAAESDRVFALPPSASSEDLWKRIKTLLPSEQILNKGDIYNDGGMSLLVQAAIATMTTRNSDGRRQAAIDMARLEGELKVKNTEVKADLTLLRTELTTLSKEIGYLTQRLSNIDNTVFTSHPGSQVMPLVEQVRSNQMGLAGVLKSIDSLDKDIHDAVKLINGRLADLQESTVTMVKSVNNRIDGVVDKKSEEKIQIKIHREKYYFQVGMAVVGIVISIIASSFNLPIAEILEKLLN